MRMTVRFLAFGFANAEPIELLLLLLLLVVDSSPSWVTFSST
jgi:hypothetical protein